MCLSIKRVLCQVHPDLTVEARQPWDLLEKNTLLRITWHDVRCEEFCQSSGHCALIAGFQQSKSLCLPHLEKENCPVFFVCFWQKILLGKRTIWTVLSIVSDHHRCCGDRKEACGQMLNTPTWGGHQGCHLWPPRQGHHSWGHGESVWDFTISSAWSPCPSTTASHLCGWQEVRSWSIFQ